VKINLDKLTVAQKVVTPLAFTLLISYGTTRKPFLFIPAIALGVLAVLLWLVRRSHEGNLYGRAMQHAEKGEHIVALGLLIMAEEAWALNVAHSTPKTIAKDFQRLDAIVAATQGQVRQLGGELSTEKIRQAIGVYIDVNSNKNNFVFGTHRLKAAAKQDIKKTSKVFPYLRAQFREACQEIYRKLDSRAVAGATANPAAEADA
jgi:hypothetical protein